MKWVMRYRWKKDSEYAYISERRMEGSRDQERGLSTAAVFSSREEALAGHNRAHRMGMAVDRTTDNPEELESWCPVPMEQAILDACLQEIE